MNLSLVHNAHFPQGIKARDLLHDYMEKAITEKLQRKDLKAHSDALDFIINGAKEQGKEFTMQELKVDPLLGDLWQAAITTAHFLHGRA